MRDPALLAQLDFEKPVRSLAERYAQIEAVGKLRLAAFKDKLLTLSQSLPLDAASHDPTAIALGRIDAAAASAEIARCAEEKIAAGFHCGSEIAAAATLPDADAAALLVRLAALPLKDSERYLVASRASDVCNRTPDERLVAPLSRWLDPDEPDTRRAAVDALLTIGSPAAARALQPRIAQEQNLRTKLRIAELLGKNGMRDGYAYAIEHVSEADLTDQAVAALLADASASEQTRRAALDTLLALKDPRLDRALLNAAGDANLERSDLLTQVERLLRERKIKLPE